MLFQPSSNRAVFRQAINTHLQSSFSPSLFHRAVFGQRSSSVIIQSIAIPPGSIRSTLIFSHHSVHRYSTGQYSVNTHLQSSFSPSLFHRAVFGQHSSSVIIPSIIIQPGRIPLGITLVFLVFGHHSVHHYTIRPYSVRHHPCLPCLRSSFCPPLYNQAVFRQAPPLSSLSSVIILSTIIQSGRIPSGTTLVFLVFGHHSVHHYTIRPYSVRHHPCLPCLRSSFCPPLYNQAVFRQAPPLSSLSSVIILSTIIQSGRIPSGTTLVFLVFGHHSVHHYTIRPYSVRHHPCLPCLRSSFCPPLYNQAVFRQAPPLSSLSSVIILSTIIQSGRIPSGTTLVFLVFGHHSVHHYTIRPYSVRHHPCLPCLRSSFCPPLYNQAVFPQAPPLSSLSSVIILSTIIQSGRIPSGTTLVFLVFGHHSVHHYTIRPYSVRHHPCLPCLRSSFCPPLYNQAVFRQAPPLSSLSSVIILSTIIQSGRIPSGITLVFLVFGHHSVHHYTIRPYSVRHHPCLPCLRSSFCPPLYNQAVFRQAPPLSSLSSVIILSTIIQPGRIPSGTTLVFLVFGHHSVHHYTTRPYSVRHHPCLPCLRSSFCPPLYNQAVFRQASPLSSLSSVIILSTIIQSGRIPSGTTLVFLVFGHHSVHHYTTRPYSVRHHPCLPCLRSSFCPPLYNQAVFRQAPPLSSLSSVIILSTIIQSGRIPSGTTLVFLVFGHHSVHHYTIRPYSLRHHPCLPCLRSSFHPSLFNQAVFRQAPPLSSLSSVIILSTIIQSGRIPSGTTLSSLFSVIIPSITIQPGRIPSCISLVSSHHCVHRYSTRQYV